MIYHSLFFLDSGEWGIIEIVCILDSSYCYGPQPNVDRSRSRIRAVEGLKRLEGGGPGSSIRHCHTFISYLHVVNFHMVGMLLAFGLPRRALFPLRDFA